MSAKLLQLGAACVCLMAAGGPALADPVGGTIDVKRKVPAWSTNTHAYWLCGGETTRIRLVGDGDTCLELRVYDEYGCLVASDTVGTGDRRVVYVTPRQTGRYTIKIRNVGDVYNEYRLILD